MMTKTQDFASRSEISMHWLFFAMAFTVIGLSVLMSREGSEKVYLPGFGVPLPPLCSFRALLGIQCPGCGLTRAFIAISHGNWAEAWFLNRASFVIYGFIVAQIPWQLFQIGRLRSGKPSWRPGWTVAWPFVLVVALLANWVFSLGGWGIDP